MAVRRHGIALPLIVAAIAALSVLAIAFVAFTQGQGRLTHRAAHGEIAYHLALSGVDAALAAVDARMRPGGALEAARDGLPAALEATSFTLDSARGGALGAVVAALEPGTDARVQVTVAFRGWHSFYPVGFHSPAGTVADPVEKAGFVEVVAKGTCGGAAREVSCLKAARVIRPVVPVLPRFTLFVKRPPEAGGLAWTEIEKRASYPAPSGVVAASATHDALVLYHGPGAYAAGDLAKGWLDRSGWVFLGSPSDGRWVFDLAYGGGGAEPEPFGESFLLTKQAMWVTSDASGKELANSEWDRLVMRSGVHAGVTADPLFARLSLGQERGRAASLHLYGSADRPSPTAVLGRVYRRSLIASYLGTKAHDRVVPLPHAGLASLDANVRAVFGDRPEIYARYMSRAVVEPYARSFDHVEKNLTGPAALDAFDPPYALAGALPRRLEPTDPDPGRKRTFLYAVDANARVKVSALDRRKLFDGDLGELSSQDLLLPERTTHVFHVSDFRRWSESGKLRVKGIMALDPAEPDLAIERPIEVEEGGVLVVRGSIEINAPITTAADLTRPLTLVALEGRIRVRAPKVHARLVALGETGVVERAGDGDLELVGGVAASRLDVGSFARGAQQARISKTLTWDPRGDDAATAFYMDRRRVVVLK